jgi:DNA-directed RNA polymerase specialized sigma24 family protein
MAVILHRFEGHTMREVAEITGWSLSAVESCLVRAYRQLREELAAWNVPLRQKESAG